MRGTNKGDLLFAFLGGAAFAPFALAAFMLHSAACDQANRHIDQWAAHGYPEGRQSGFQYRYCQIVRQPYQVLIGEAR